jgi:hypothetical protein
MPGTVGVRVLVRVVGSAAMFMGVRGFVVMVVIVFMPRLVAVRVLMLVFMRMPVRVFLDSCMIMRVGVRVGMRMAMRQSRARPCRIQQRRRNRFRRHAIYPGGTRLSTSTILAHYDISTDTNSISRPRRSSPLTPPQSGHSQRNSGDSNSLRHVAHHITAGTVSISNRAPAAGVPGRNASKANSKASVTTPESRPTRRRSA